MEVQNIDHDPSVVSGSTVQTGKIIQAGQRSTPSPEATEELMRVTALPDRSQIKRETETEVAKAKPSFGSSFIQTIKETERSLYCKMEQEMRFEEFLDHVYENPRRFVRNSAGNTIACMESYGVEEKVIMGRKVLDFVGLRTWCWQPENVEHRKELVGQEIPTYEFYLAMKQAAKQEFPDEIYMFHGKPGGGKTRLAETLEAGLEHFSRYDPEGSSHVLTFVFDDEKEFRAKTKGFSYSSRAEQQPDTDEELGGYRIRASMNTNPIFLVSPDRPSIGDLSPREQFYEQLAEAGKVDQDFPKNYLLGGKLDSTSASIYEALLKHYKGDAEAVIKNHVRVERWTMSSQVGRGLVSIRPNPDRGSEVEDMYPSHPLHGGQPTPEQLAAFERDIQLVHGIIPNANRGHVHFCDMLRDNERDRSQVDLSRLDYLLETVEGGKLQVNSHRNPSLYREEKIDVVFRADTNDAHIIQKSEGAGWEAFKQRCHFIAVPCIRRFLEEARAHRTKLNQLLGDDREAAPHVLETLALFSTATRLLTPIPNYYTKIHEDLPAVVRSMNVVEKALLLQGESAANPDRDMNILRSEGNKLSSDKIALLRRHTEQVADEHMKGVGETRFSLYDGGIGVSTRETGKLLKQILRFRPNEDLTVLEVCDVLEQRLKGGLKYDAEVEATKEHLRQQLVAEIAKAEGYSMATLKDRSYEFNKVVQKANEKLDELYPIPAAKDIVEQVKLYAKGKVQTDIYTALGLVNEENSEFTLKRYINHVVSWNSRGSFQVRKEFRLSSQSDGKGDEAVMEDFEKNIAKKSFYYDSDKEKYRSGIGTSIGAWQLNNEGKSFEDNVEAIFPDLMNDIRKAQKDARQKVLTEFLQDTERYVASPELLKRDMAEPGNRARAQEWEKHINVLEKMGYPRGSLGKHIYWAFGSMMGK